MATTKNITMKQFNGTDYDTLYPKTIASQIPDVYSKTDTITANTLSQFGLSANKLPNDAFQRIKALIDGKTNIQTGSYLGTGTYGEESPSSLTFNFTPKLVFIHLDRLGTTSTNEGYYLWGSTTFSSYTGNSNYQSTASVSGNTMTWYASREINAETQLNEINAKYVWCAIG